MFSSPTIILKKNVLLLLMLLTPALAFLYAQVTINKPSLGFTQICANNSFNSFEITFTFNPAGGFSAGNQFILELSDSTGSFASATSLSYNEKVGSSTTTSRTFIFAVPNTIGGENFRLRIRSTAPAVTSPTSNSFAAYYKLQDTQFTINNFNGTATYCSGGSLVLRIDNPGTGTNDSPLKYPSLTYKWFKEPSLTPIATTPTLTVNQPGRYYVETNYGTCTSDSFSNRVTVTEAAGATASITSSKGNPFCASEGPTTLSTQAGNSYQWFLNDNPISGATGQEYVAAVGGQYSVRVDFGGCTANASLKVDEVSFNASLNVGPTTIIREGDSRTIVATTNAVNPVFEWYFNGTLIPSATSNTLEVTLAGSYSVSVSQNSGCVSKKDLPFQISYPFVDPNVVLIPNLISPNNDGVNDTWILPQEYVSGSNAEVLIMDARGEIVLKTNDYQNNWPENVLETKAPTPIYYYIITTQDNQVKKGSITVLK